MSKVTSDTKSEIIKIALQLFLQKGYKEVSYQDIIKMTGLSKGAIYHYFKSKEDLLANVFEFLLKSTQQPAIKEPENKVKDFATFRKLFINAKTEQLNHFKKLMKTKSLKFNKILFFLEAINENERIKKIILQLMEEEITFLKKCFLGLQKHRQLPEGKDPTLLAENLYWILQGRETLMLFMPNKDLSADFIKMYDKTITDFFKTI